MRPKSDAVAGFMHLVRYRDALDALMETPPSLPQGAAPDVASARSIVDQAIADGRTWLDPIEVTRLLTAYAIPVTPAVLARNADEAATAAEPFLAMAARRSWSRFCRPTSSTSRTLAAFGSI